MSQWKEGNNDYIPEHDMESTLLTKHNIPHTPTPTLSLYELPDQHLQNHHHHQQQQPQHAQQQQQHDQQYPPWNFQDHTRPKYVDFETRNDYDKEKRRMESTSLSSSSSLLHPLAHVYVDMNTDGSSVRPLSNQVIPPVTIPANHHQEHRAINQGMVSVDHHHHHHLHHNNNNNSNNNNNNHHPQQHQQKDHVSHSHYQQQQQQQQQLSSSKYSYSRSFPDTSHSLLSYHHHSSQQQQQRHISNTAEQAAVQAAAVAAAYQPHSINPSSQMTWYTQHPTFQKNGIYHPSVTSRSLSPLTKRHHESPSSSSSGQDSSVHPTEGNDFAPMPGILSSSRIDDVDYNISSSSSSSSSSSPAHLLDQHRHSHQWTSSTVVSSPSASTASTRQNEMQSLSSMSFSSMNKHNSADQQEASKVAESRHDKIDTTLTPDGDASSIKEDDSNGKEGKKKSQTKPPKRPQTGKRRSPNAFFVFCSDRRPILKQGKPNARNTDINRQLGDDWKSLSQEERDWYKQKADRIRAELPSNDDSTLFPSQYTFTDSNTNIAGTTSDGNTAKNAKDIREQQLRLPSSFDTAYSDFNTLSPISGSESRSNSFALTIAADDESTSSSYGTGELSKRGSMAHSDLSLISTFQSSPTHHGHASSFFHRSNNNATNKNSNRDSDNQLTTTDRSPGSSPPQHLLNVASISGAAEASALDQVATVGIHPLNRTILLPTEKTERLKRPPNAYLLFNREMRRKLLNQQEKLTVAAISKLISESWRNLSPDKKDIYKNEATKLKQQHFEDHPNYVYSRRSRSELEQAGYRSRPSKRHKKSGDGKQETLSPTTFGKEWPDKDGTLPPKLTLESTKTTMARSMDVDNDGNFLQQDQKRKQRQQKKFPDPRGRKKKKHKNPFGPKHPMSGFLFFASHVRPDIVRDYPKSNVGTISKVIAEKWRKLTDEEKAPWIEKASEDKARYAREMEAFNLAQEGKEEGRQKQNDHKEFGWVEANDDIDTHSPHTTQTKKSSISSLSSSTTLTTTAASSPTSSPSAKDSIGRTASQEHVDYHYHHNHHDNHRRHSTSTGKEASHHHGHHMIHQPQSQQQQQQHSILQQRQNYKPVSRLHSALASSRPASPTELDSHIIATVAQMVNPRNHTPSLSSARGNDGSTSAHDTSGRLGSNAFHQHRTITPSSLTSIMHNHHDLPVGSFQLHVPATPPSPAVDTI